MNDAVPPDTPELPMLPPVEPVKPRDPFWGYHDLFVLVGLFVVSLIAGFATVSGVILLLRLQVHNELWRLLPAQFVAYLYLFLALWLLFRTQYGRPFWSSLGWTNMRFRPISIISSGLVLAFAVVFLARFLKTPDVTPLTKMLSDRTSILLMVLFGSTVGPMCEELIFRGFLQPLFARSLGVIGGILGAALLFGLLHLQEYGNSWRHGLLITTAGAAFGWMRWRTGSTKASTLMHAAYNGTFFVALLMQPKNLPH